MSLVRQYMLDSQYAQVASGMGLRRPQSESLETVRDLLRRLPGPVRDLDSKTIAEHCRQYWPDFEFAYGYPSLTFALATGVGKTRLIGALAAYLYRTGESRNFVILAPRDAILRKFEKEVREADEKYIFVDRGLVPQPRIHHRGNLKEFRPAVDGDELLPTGPNVFVYSPQLIAVGGRISETSQFAGVSVEEYLQHCDDLVVFVDEGHHISTRERDDSARSWGGALSRLRPKLVFELTATPREGAAVAYEYGLAQCLRERLYTKAVRLIVDNAGTHLTDEDEYDRYTLRFAVGRLEDKRQALANVRGRISGLPLIRPILLVAAKDTAHADAVGRLLVEEFDFAENEVLVIHSKRKSEQDMLALASIEGPDSPIRAVVQVHVLDEGWDVANVYVVAPLRNVQSYVNAKQVMGRGLRLPAGRRIGDEEADTLDVLAFGQETFQSVFDQARVDFGPPNHSAGGVQVVKAGDGTATQQLPVKQPDDPRKPQSKVTVLSTLRTAKCALPLLDLTPPEPKLDVIIEFSGFSKRGRSAFDLGALTTTSVSGDLRMERERFIGIAVDQIFREFVYLSDPLHRTDVTGLVEAALEEIGESSDKVGVDPLLCAKIIVEKFSEFYFREAPKYRDSGLVESLEIAAVQANVPMSYVAPATADAVHASGWSRQDHFRIPIGNWQRCIHDAAHFDSRPEFDIAYRLDSMHGIDFWLRNEPGQIALPTLAGNTKPDFVVWLSDGRRLLLEIKGEYLWEPESPSWIRARDTNEWLKAAADAAGDKFAFVLLLGASVSHVVSLDDIFANDEIKNLN